MLILIKVGLIDSGVSEAQLQLVANQRDFTGNGTVVDQLGHGSAIVDRLLSAQVDIEICVARIFADQLLCGVEECAAAVDWLVGLEPSLITMSFGLRRDSRILREACSAAVEAGVGIVAASPAQGQPVYPAHYPGVLRATGDARCGMTEIAWLNSEQADVGGYVGDPAAGPAGASIGCASVASRLLTLIVEHPGEAFTDVVRLLQETADYRGRERRQ